MAEKQTFTFVDGGRTRHTAHIEPGDGADTLVLDLFGKKHRASIRLHRGGEGAPTVGVLAGKVTPLLAELCYALLHAFRNIWDLSYGASVALQIDGRRLIARYQEHPPDAGVNAPHPGVTLFEDVSVDVIEQAPVAVEAPPPEPEVLECSATSTGEEPTDV